MKRIYSLLLALFLAGTLHAAEKRPNIVWIVGEDMGPELGCYGDSNAITPNMDRLAREGARFIRCFTHAPVCAPSRSGLITGRYPTSIGSHHMRSTLINPPPPFTRHLREAGYHVSWPGKTDFNFANPTKDFDSTADWTKGKAPAQPFFAYINFTVSHESQIRGAKEQFVRNVAQLKPEERRDPAKMAVPPYHPDTPVVRRDLANYYDLVTAVDYKVGEVLKWLDQQGVAENTVVFLTGDHGRGLPRSKRWVYDSGIHVPLVVRWPGHVKAASVREDLVCFLDFSITALALAGAEMPKELQGQVILGSKTAPPRKYIFAARDRMDETPDRIRAVRSERFKYIRNFQPELPYAQQISYMELSPTMQEWRRLNGEGKLTGPQKLFFAPMKPREELYDLDADPHEINNLAERPAHVATLQEMRAALDRWMAESKDLGAIPETELIKRGLVADRLKEYEQRKEPGSNPNTNRKKKQKQ
ncbi:MAG: sulfatase [Pedosphaera sp.]|nr:sulfatase [Pedosphaera sp.]